MGVYLSTPITDKDSEDGEHGFLRYGASAMQGWRKGMEDAHIALGALPGSSSSENGSTTQLSMFAVFDGHGGPEVANFCKVHMPHQIQALPEFQAGDFEGALKRVFHRMDELLESGEHRDELTQYKKASEARPQATGSEEEDSNGVLSAQDALQIFQKLLSMSNGGPAASAQGAVPTSKGEEDNEADNDDDDADADCGETVLPKLSDQTIEDVEETGATSSVNSLMPVPNDEELPLVPPQSNIQVCSLPDHPLQAGCTSVVVLLVNRTLYIANAGDSRAVISRGGVAMALSRDHKPAQRVETNRIHLAGGFITPAGRVNGNLNLSRSIGDLKYKQNNTLPKKDQMITAEPDVTRVDLQKEDEFIIIGCDGIWDCKTNQQAVDFVRERLSQGMVVSKICEELMDNCISEDPRKTTGIGGDNMTCVVVQFKPE